MGSQSRLRRCPSQRQLTVTPQFLFIIDFHPQNIYYLSQLLAKTRLLLPLPQGLSKERAKTGATIFLKVHCFFVFFFKHINYIFRLTKIVAYNKVNQWVSQTETRLVHENNIKTFLKLRFTFSFLDPQTYVILAGQFQSSSCFIRSSRERTHTQNICPQKRTGVSHNMSRYDEAT